MIARAADAGADLVVLPELCNSSYVFNTREEARNLAEEIPDGPACRVWTDAAARHEMHIVAGIAEREGRALYNSAVVVGPQGLIGTYRKNHLWGAENLFFEPGNLGGALDTSSNGALTARGCRLPNIAPGRMAEQ